MQGSVDAAIAELRRVVGAQTDAELARHLALDKSALTAWRSRGRVPERYQSFLAQVRSGEPFQEFEIWPELQSAGQRIALIRFTLLRQKDARSGNIDQAMQIFKSLRPFWLIMYRAVHDVRLKMMAVGAELKTAQALVMQQDLRDPEATAVRVAGQLAEDISDNPTLFGLD